MWKNNKYKSSKCSVSLKDDLLELSVEKPLNLQEAKILQSVIVNLISGKEMILKETEVYTINGQEYKFTADVEQGIFNDPKAVFTNDKSTITVVYNKIEDRYEFSEPVDIKIEYSISNWIIKV